MAEIGKDRDPHHQLGEAAVFLGMTVAIPKNTLPGITKNMSEAIVLLREQNSGESVNVECL